MHGTLHFMLLCPTFSPWLDIKTVDYLTCDGVSEISLLSPSMKGVWLPYYSVSPSYHHLKQNHPLFTPLGQILDPAVRQLNAYGLSKHSVPFAGVAGEDHLS